VPERKAWEEKIRTWNWKESVTVSADVTIEPANRSVQISAEQAGDYIRALIGDRMLYDAIDTVVYTQDYIQAELEYQRMAFKDEGTIKRSIAPFCGTCANSPTFPSEEERRSRFIADTKNRIKVLELALQSAAQTRYQEPALMTFNDRWALYWLHDIQREWPATGKAEGVTVNAQEYAERVQYFTDRHRESIGKNGSIEGIADMGNGWEAHIEVYPDQLNYERYRVENKTCYPMKDSTYSAGPLTISQQEAEKLVMDLANKLGIRQMKIEKVSNDGYEYWIQLAPAWMGMEGESDVMIPDADTYWEYMYVRVDELGIKSVQWSMREQVPENTVGIHHMLNFDAVQERGREELKAIAADREAGARKELTVTRVILKLRETQQGTMIPVWEFWGEEIITKARQNPSVASNQCLLILDAVTGEVHEP